MKTAVISSPSIASSDIEESKMGMDSSGMDLASFFLRDKIYSNKILAVVREYACNAIDEHLKHKIKVPVDIGLRYNDDKTASFFCRDYAKGLSEKNVRGIFGMYFKSTKSKSNDSIGGFGVGSKAGHCYGDTFYVASFFEGKKTTYSCMLGGGKNGVPVGTIYKIDETPTSERGLEISMPIEDKDQFSFEKEILKIIKYSSWNINCNIFDNISVPETPFAEYKMDRFHIKAYNSRFEPSAVIQMGGVRYASLPIKDIIKSSTTLVVDCPIGTFGIPISREKLEDSNSNAKVLSEICNFVSILAKEDLSTFYSLSDQEIIKARSGDINYFHGAIFSKNLSHHKNWNVLKTINKMNGDKPIEQKNNKDILVCFAPNPHNKSSCDHWFDKLRNHCLKYGVNYYIIKSSEMAVSNFQDLNFEVVCVKKIKFDKLPKVDKMNQRYAVHFKSKKIGMLTALELHNTIRKHHAFTEAHDIAEAKLQNAASNIDSFNKLKTRCVCDSLNYNGHGYKCLSAQMIENCRNIGLIIKGSKEYDAINKKLHDKMIEDQTNLHLSTFLGKKRFFLSDRTTSIVNNNPKKCTKIMNFFQKIKRETSLRNKIIESIDNSYGNTFQRHELRKILLLK